MNQPVKPEFAPEAVCRTYLSENARRVPPPSAAAAEFEAVKILMVDDDADVRNDTAQVLEKAGYRVELAADAEAALLAVRQRRPDLLLLDRAMPGQDGLEVCRRIKQDPAFADIMVILMSKDYTESSQQAEALDFGADGYIARPIANRELLARMQAHVRILSLTRALQAKVRELEIANAAASQGALASLNLVEDAMAARDQMNATNQQLRQEVKERQRMELYRAMGVEVLQILNEPGELPDTIQRVIAVLKRRTGFNAVGLRLQEGEDFPYYAQEGFSPKFLRAENSVLERGRDDSLCRERDGHVYLGCMCGLVLSGRSDPDNPLFTRGGSFWINDSCALRALPGAQDPRLHLRNTCIHQGYASVALVPIRTKDRIVGLIQLNDRHKERFTLESIELLESIAAHIGAGLMRRRAEDEREHYRMQLIQSQKLESIGVLASGVAHEINNPIMGIMGYAQLIQDRWGAGDAELREFAAEIGKETDRVATIVKNLLSFARQDKETQCCPTRAHAIVEATLSLIRVVLRHDQIALEVNVPADLPAPICNSQQIQQVLMNLLTNARDALNQRYPGADADKLIRISAEFTRRNAEGLPRFRLTVEDHGAGIPEAVRARIFEPFFTTKPREKGTGLGLSISHGIVKEHGGELSVESEEGQWTRFHVDLPVPVEGAQNAEQRA